jgi:hypothetical protein
MQKILILNIISMNTNPIVVSTVACAVAVEEDFKV